MRHVGVDIVEKIERDGKVAVLVSPGFGAGWSTWSNDDIRESMCMNAEIVQAVLDGDKAKAAEIAERLHPNVYTGGCDDLVVEWVPKGEAFEITEYDGSESLVVIGQQTYMIA